MQYYPLNIDYSHNGNFERHYYRYNAITYNITVKIMFKWNNYKGGLKEYLTLKVEKWMLIVKNIAI